MESKKQMLNSPFIGDAIYTFRRLLAVVLIKQLKQSN